MEEKKYIFKKLYKKHFPKNKTTQDCEGRSTLRHSKIGGFFLKKKILGASRLKDKFTHKGKKIRLSYFSTIKIYERRNIMREFKVKDNYYGIPYSR